MKFIASVSLGILLTLALLGNAFSQQNHTLITVSEETTLNAAEERSYVMQRYVTNVSIPHTLHESDRLEVQLPHGKSDSFEIIRITEFLPGITSVSARSVQSPETFLTVNWNEEGVMFSRVADYLNQEFHHLTFHPETSRHYMERVDISQMDILECHNHEDILEYHNHRHDDSGFSPDKAKSTMQSMPRFVNRTGQTRYTTGTSNSTTIDILLVYTPKAEDWANIPTSGGLNFIVAEMMNISQLALDNSQIPVLLRVVGLRRLAYDHDGDNGPISSGNHLRRLTVSNTFNPFGLEHEGFMMEVHEWREELGADMVSALMRVSDVGGVAWLGSGPAPNPDIMFSVNRIQQMTTTFTFVHELGHNWGLSHSRNQSTGIAGLFGGAFQYSTGWRFTGNNSQSYATVMTYEESSTRIPYFANPDVTFQGTPTGAYGGSMFAPSDAARTIRNTAPYVAGILPSKVNGPDAVLSGEPIQIQMEPNTTTSHTLTIGNSGQSRLYVRPEVQRSSATTSEDPILDYDWLMRHQNATTQIPGIGLPPLWGSTFSSSQGFQTGTFSITNDWVIGSRNQSDTFQVLNDGDSNNFIRISHLSNRPSNAFVSVRSSYDGFFPNGAYQLETELRINSADDNYYLIQLLDPTIDNGNQAVTWLQFRNGGIIRYSTGLNAQGDTVYETSSVLWVANEFKKLEIFFTPEDNGVHIFYDNQHVGSSSKLSATKPIMAQVYRFNSSQQGSIDIREMIMTSLYEGFEYVRATPANFTVQAGNTSDVQINFNTDGLNPGTYTAQLNLHTNDADKELISIPITLTVTGDVSVPESEIPYQTELAQNYPNPFNPTTNIRYQIPESGNVTLEVFNVAGQRVQTLVNGVVSAGSHTVSFDARNLSSGIYMYRLSTDSGVFTRKMMLIK